MDAAPTTRDQSASTTRRPVRLRGELWQRHVRLQELDPAESDYQDTVDELLELTSELLTAEAEEARARQLAQRRASDLLYYLGAGLLVAAVVLGALTTSRLGGWVLVSAVMAALLTTLLLHRWYRRRTTPALPEPDDPGGQNRERR